MENLTLDTLFILLVVLVCLSAFFSSSETGLMSLNPYKLRHKSKESRAAALAQKNLKRPDRLLGVILLGNNFVNIYATALVTVIALKLGVPLSLASIAFTFVILVFAEITPKTLAALFPERVAFPAIYILQVLLWIFYPFVWFINGISNTMFKLIGIQSVKKGVQHLTQDELRTLVHETAGRVPLHKREMVISILDLETVLVDEIMVPRVEIIGLDLDDSELEIKQQLASTQHTFLPVYRGSINQIEGILHTRYALNLLADDTFSIENLLQGLKEPYFVPEATSLTMQLIKFRENKEKIALVVNEYGDIQGMVAIEDILEEVVGEFTTDMAQASPDVHPQDDGTFLVDASINIRDLNRALSMDFSTSGPKTLSGLIIEYLETIPEAGTCCLLNQVPIEVVQVLENKIKTVRISQPISSEDES